MKYPMVLVLPAVTKADILSFVSLSSLATTQSAAIYNLLADDVTACQQCQTLRCQKMPTLETSDEILTSSLYKLKWRKELLMKAEARRPTLARQE